VSLPAPEQAVIEGLAHAHNGAGFAGRDGSLAMTMFEIARARITAERHSAKILSFEQWRPTRRAA
jgi:hypothetical protein